MQILLPVTASVQTIKLVVICSCKSQNNILALQESNSIMAARSCAIESVKLYSGGQVMCYCKSQITFWRTGHFQLQESNYIMAGRSNTVANGKLYTCRQVKYNCKSQIIFKRAGHMQVQESNNIQAGRSYAL